MAMTTNVPNTTATTTAPTGNYKSALVVVTTLFFMWGSLTSLNDVLIPYVQHVFNIRLAASMLIQTAFFSAYFIFSIPAAKIIDWIGYKRAIVVGLLTMVAACLFFYPAAKIPSFPFFLAALIILATGITILQVAANPYVAVLGPPRTASSRLNLAQAFNSLGTTIAPYIGGLFILSTAPKSMDEIRQMSSDVLQAYRLQQASSIKGPYLALGLIAIALGIAIAAFKLPPVPEAERHTGDRSSQTSLWKHPNLIFGAIGIFVYVGGEVAIGSSIANYLALDNIGHLVSPSIVPDAAARYHAALAEAARYISLYWLGAMVGRFIGSALLQKIKPGKLLALSAVLAALLVTVSVFSNGHLAMWSILAVGLFNSIMFPCIFTMGIAELGPLTGDGSGIMNMAIVGGAVIPFLVGQAADLINRSHYPAMTQGETSWGQGIHYALIIPTLCYVYILFFALSGSKPNSERSAKA